MCEQWVDIRFFVKLMKSSHEILEILSAEYDEASMKKCMSDTKDSKKN